MERVFRNIPEMYAEMMLLMRLDGEEENSRNGRVLSLQEPLLVRVVTPTVRVNVDPVRRCNPFFHVMEFVWMMSGGIEPDWILQFNKRFKEYADPDTNEIHGAYGYRWRKHFNIDQIKTAVRMLQDDPSTRRAVLGMWDPMTDLGTQHNDLPCNTHIYLRIVDGGLDMTVCNRSNDVIWGMTGANAVHMTLLQELIANAVGCPVGVYSVFTVNAHVYLDLPRVKEMLTTSHVEYPEVPEGHERHNHVPLLTGGETLDGFLFGCERFVQSDRGLGNVWLDKVATPMYYKWFNRTGEAKILDTRWSVACNQWLHH